MDESTMARVLKLHQATFAPAHDLIQLRGYLTKCSCGTDLPKQPSLTHAWNAWADHVAEREAENGRQRNLSCHAG